MKIKRHDLSGFSDLGTAVFYQTRTFHAEVQGTKVSNLDIVLEKASSTCFLYSTELNSEYIDFAKYDFKFNLPESEYWSSLELNQYDYEDTVSKFGKSFDTISQNLVPQLYGTKDYEDKHFFGRIANSENTIFLIHIPSKIENISDSLLDTKTIWKVEFYNSRLTTNNTLGDAFIDYDVLSVFKPEDIIEEPVLSVYFGPSWDTQLQDYTLSEVPDEYLSRYSHRLLDNNKCCLTEDLYNSFTSIISKSEYIKLVSEEINSEKVLYIINTTNGDLKTIDLFSAGYQNSKLKYRNQDKNILRNDKTLGDKILRETEGMVFDSRSSVLLGVGGNTNDCPLLRDKISQTLYSGSSDLGEITIMGKTYIHPKNQEILGENPETSPFWISKDDIKDSMFSHFYITKTGHGVVKPFGMVYLRSDKTLELKVTPDKGYQFDGFTGLKKEDWESNGDIKIPKIQNTGDKFNIVFKESVYTLRLNLSCDSDYPNFGESHIYSLSDFGEKHIELWYYDYVSKKDILYKGEQIDITYTTPFKFWISTKDSLYYTPEDNKYFFLEDSSVTLKNTKKYTILSVSETPEQLLESSKIITIVGALKSKQYIVNIETSKEIQVSTKKKLTFEYGDGVEIKFASDNGEIKFIILNEDTGELENWEKTIDDDGIITLSLPERTRELDSGIKHNYKITASI